MHIREGRRITLQVPLWVPQYLIPRTLLQNHDIDTKTNSSSGFNGSIVGEWRHPSLYSYIYFTLLFSLQEECRHI